MGSLLRKEQNIQVYNGVDGTWTHTYVYTTDFESVASADSATTPWVDGCLIKSIFCVF